MTGRVLLDTNILIHRESNRVHIQEIGSLFRWLDNLKYEKFIHPLSLDEIEKYKDNELTKSIRAKLGNYNLLKTTAPDRAEIVQIRAKYDRNENDQNDSTLLNEVFAGRVDILLTEDRKLHRKARELNIDDKIFTIDSFLEKVTLENPELVDYKVLSVKKEFFGNINLKDNFFDSFRNDYYGFDNWFNQKANEEAYICYSDKNELLAFLYLKIEKPSENYSDITPTFLPKTRLKIGTFKVVGNGFKLGERFLKIAFDNATVNHVDEIYVTMFNRTDEQLRLIGLLTDWGFEHLGNKITKTGEELVFIKNYKPMPDRLNPKLTYPFIDNNRRYFLVPIYPSYHTELLPDSILNNESPSNFVENEPHRNAIKKVYISRSYYRNLNPGDVIIFYRTKTPGTSAIYSSVVTTIGIVEGVHQNISNFTEFQNKCRKRSVFTNEKLREFWDYQQNNRPFVVDFLYLRTFPKRPNLQKLLELGVISGMDSVPRGFQEISKDDFYKILETAKLDESFIINQT